MAGRHAARPVRSQVQSLERRTMLSGYAATAVAALPSLASTTFNNGAEQTPLVRDAAGNLYGFDPLGGPSGTGPVFDVNPTTGPLTTLGTGGASGNLYPKTAGSGVVERRQLFAGPGVSHHRTGR